MTGITSSDRSVQGSSPRPEPGRIPVVVSTTVWASTPPLRTPRTQSCTEPGRDQSARLWRFLIVIGRNEKMVGCRVSTLRPVTVMRWPRRSTINSTLFQNATKVLPDGCEATHLQVHVRRTERAAQCGGTRSSQSPKSNSPNTTRRTHGRKPSTTQAWWKTSPASHQREDRREYEACPERPLN
jgi:hypothetical protein